MSFVNQSFIDHLGRKVFLPNPASRVVSLVPSLTELIIDLAGSPVVVGRTSFCIHPQEKIREIAKIGGTKNPNIDSIRKLQADLIIANKEENRQEDIEALSSFVPIWVSDISNSKQLLECITQLGIILDLNRPASFIHQRLSQILLPNPVKNGMKVVYLIWKDPFMTIGGDTYINEMLGLCGFENIFKNHSRYPELSIEQITNSGADLILLSSEPYPFKASHEEKLSRLFGNIPCKQVNGEIFSWYGSRLIHLEPEWEQLKSFAQVGN